MTIHYLILLAALIRETLQRMKFEILEHLAYNPDLAPFVFHIFGPVKGAVSVHIFV
jgi:hypothetical protein